MESVETLSTHVTWWLGTILFAVCTVLCKLQLLQSFSTAWSPPEQPYPPESCKCCGGQGKRSLQSHTEAPTTACPLSPLSLACLSSESWGPESTPSSHSFLFPLPEGQGPHSTKKCVSSLQSLLSTALTLVLGSHLRIICWLSDRTQTTAL